MNDYISRAEAVALAIQYCPDDDGVCSKAGHDLRELLDDLENAPPADVWPREKVLQAIAVGLAKAGIPIGGRVHQCIFNALPPTTNTRKDEQS